MRNNEYIEKHLGLLVGKTIKNIIVGEDDENIGKPVYGFRFTDGTMAWILCDPEGNGPGHLDITNAKGETLAP